MQPPLLFIHGMFLNPKSWDKWLGFFQHRGYTCEAPAWPLHEGNPAELRERVPPGLGELGLEAVVDHYAGIASAAPQAPVLIGHSMGGLIAQLLLSRGIGRAGVCLSSVAPNRMLSLDWSSFKNSAAILNPLMGDQPYRMTPAEFHENFCNTLTLEEAQTAYHEYVVHESRNVMRDSMGRLGHIDLDRPHPPLLFVAGDRDQIIPDKLNRRNAEAYTHSESISDFQDFAGRSHFIHQEPGWQAVASFLEGWLAANIAGEAPIGFTLR
jgi:pimeloyl-ACP methyl ester carboxylesterase